MSCANAELAMKQITAEAAMDTGRKIILRRSLCFQWYGPRREFEIRNAEEQRYFHSSDGGNDQSTDRENSSKFRPRAENTVAKV